MTGWSGYSRRSRDPMTHADTSLQMVRRQGMRDKAPLVHVEHTSIVAYAGAG